jgi:hypothetical protein
VNKADRLRRLVPDGYVHAGDSRADLPFWQSAKGAVVVSSSRSLCAAVQSMGVPVEKIFEDKPTRPKAWLWVRAARPHPWTKNAVVLVPLILGWRDVTFSGLLTTLAEIAVFCLAASLTYIINDLADLSLDRKHWSKRRPFASAAIPVRDGLLLAGFALSATCLLAFLISPPAGIFVLAYVVLTLGYSFGWKRIPLFDAFMIASLFVIRVLIGIAAASLVPSCNRLQATARCPGSRRRTPRGSNHSFTTSAPTPFPPRSPCDIFIPWCGDGPYREERPLDA